MKPVLKRIMIFLALVIAAILIIIGVASVSHASECLPSARAVWATHPGSHATWNAVDDMKCWRVGYGRHHRKEVMPLAGRQHGRGKATMAVQQNNLDTRPRSANSPAGAVHWKHPEHAKPFEEFEDWLYLAK